MLTTSVEDDRSISRYVDHKKLLESVVECVSAKDMQGIFTLLDYVQTCTDFSGAACAMLDLKQKHSPIVGGFNHSYQSDWIDTYTKENLNRVDPVVIYALQSDNAFQWSEALQHISYDRTFWDAAMDYGLCGGLSMAKTVPVSNYRIILSFANYAQEIDVVIRYLIRVVHPVISDALHHQPLPWICISEKEKEILKWCGEGKTVWETSLIVSLSESTTKYHLNNIYKKLNVSNRTQAVAKAIQLNLI